MSQANKESIEDSENELNEVSSESSSSSTDSCCSTTSTGSSSDSSSTVTGTSDPDTSDGNPLRDSECSSYSGQAFSGSDRGHCVRRQQLDGNSPSKTKTGQICDIRNKETNCPSAPESQSRLPADLGELTEEMQKSQPSSTNTPPKQLPQSSGRSQVDIDTQINQNVAQTSTTGLDKIERRLGKFNNQLSRPTLSTDATSCNNTLDPSRKDFKKTLRPAPSPSPSPSLSAIDPNNNKNLHGSKVESLSCLRRTNFSKSASGSRLINTNNSSIRTSARPNVCDCLSQDCGEKEHSNRRQFIEQYYNSRTCLPSANAISSFNINTPLNRLSECDAITKRLLSSPIRTTNITDSPNRRTHVLEIDRSRRASLGTNTITDQVFLFASNQFNSLELNCRRTPEGDSLDEDNLEGKDDVSSPRLTHQTDENDVKLKQQQGRSLSVCDEETLKPRYRKSNQNHSSNLNRAVSLAYESGSSRRLLTIIPLFGCDIKSLEQFMKLGLILPPPIDSAVDYILAIGIDAVGIFRKSGVRSRINALKQRIEANQDSRMDEINKDNEYSIYDIADLVKMWFRELRPSPLMTKELINAISDHLQMLKQPQHQGSRDVDGKAANTSQGNTNMSSTNESDRCQAQENLKYRISTSIEPSHKALFSKALSFFSLISSRSDTNQMTSQNLAICLTPSLCATESDQDSIIRAQKTLEYCIDNYRILF